MTTSSVTVHQVPPTSDLCSALYPAYILERCFGLSEFTIEGAPMQRKLAKINRKGVYKLAFYALVLTGTLGLIYLNDVLIPFHFTNVLYLYVNVFDLHSDFVQTWLIILCVSWRRNLLVKTWEDALMLDEDIIGLKIGVNNIALKAYSTAWIFLSGLSTIIAHVVANDFTSHQTVNFFITSNYIFCAQNLLKLSLVTTFSVWLLSLKSRFEALNNFLFENNCGFFSLENLQVVEKVHQELCRMTRIINRVYSTPMAMSFFIDYFMLVFQVYDVFTLVVQSEYSFDDLMQAALMTSLFAPHTALTITAGALVTKHANFIKHRLHKLALETKDDKLKKEVSNVNQINAFALQLLHENVEITAGGFFVIDWPLLFKMVSAGTTYLVILVQFSDLSV